MNRLRCFFFAAMLVISSSTLALGGEIQGPGKSDPIPTSAASINASTSDDLTQPTSTEQAPTILTELLLTIY